MIKKAYDFLPILTPHITKGIPKSKFRATTYKWMPSEKTRGETSHDPKAIITTYEGNHNHDVPTSKSSSNHDNQPRYRPDETDTISLNLEVGISLMDMTTVTARNSIVKIVKG
ncbi:hypothetical protein YC2023_016183 [Brassica napus]